MTSIAPIFFASEIASWAGFPIKPLLEESYEPHENKRKRNAIKGK